MSHNKFRPPIESMDWLTEGQIKQCIHNYGIVKPNVDIKKYTIQKASDRMLGFLADYWKVRVYLSSTKKKNTLTFFIKAVSQNASKAEMAKEMKFFEREINFYHVIKRNIELPGVKPWSAKFILANNDAIIFEDLNALGYKSKDKFETFDSAHTKQALHMLARFHACSIVYEHRKRTLLDKSYNIYEEFEPYLDKGGYYDTNVWFVQCMEGALAAIKTFSKYKDHEEIITIIDNDWEKIWSSGLDLSNVFPGECNVICHRDLWNNNMLFRYNNVKNVLMPEDCIMVDFQAVLCHPPAGDVMLLLYCNLDPNFREENMNEFLRIYHKNLELILNSHGIKLCDVLSLQSFLQSAEKYRLWALVVSACLFPQIWLEDDLTTKMFCDPRHFQDILCNDKASFIKEMMKNNDRYRIKVMQIFEEIVDRYCQF